MSSGAAAKDGGRRDWPGELRAAVEGLDCAFGLERSAKFSPGQVDWERFLLSLHKRALGDDPGAVLRRLADKFGLDEPFIALLLDQLPHADLVHFGAEGGANAVLKIYLEFAERARQAMVQPDAVTEPVLVHLAVKWRPDNPGSVRINRYHWDPLQPFLAECALDLPVEVAALFAAAGEASRARCEPEALLALQVTEDGSTRRSVDVNLYPTGLTVGDFAEPLRGLGAQLDVPAAALEALLSVPETRRWVIFRAVSMGLAALLPPCISASKRDGAAAMAEIIERTAPGDLYRDYCLWDYKPRAPTGGKLRSATLLWQSFEALGAPPPLRAMVEALRAELGPFRIVWGVKKLADRFSWELYFYDYARLSRDVSIERVLAALRPFALSTLSLSPARPYFMFSVDLDAELGRGERSIDEISVYIGNPGAGLTSGISYDLSASGLWLGNLYYFYDAHKDWDEVVGKLACSAHLDLGGFDLDHILWPELRDCGVIVVANKKHCDGVYFSRITVDQLIGFVARLHYPAPVVHFLSSHRDELDHMVYDVGIDYRMASGGRVEILKSAYYGVV